MDNLKFAQHNTFGKSFKYLFRLRAGTYDMSDLYSNACIVILINISLLFQLQDFLLSFQKVE